MLRVFKIITNVQFFRYIFSGGTAAATNLVVLYLLVAFAHWHYLIASGCAFVTALLVSFLLHKLFTFRDTRMHLIPVQILLYTFFLLCNIGINLMLMWVLVDMFNVMYLVAQVLVSGLIAIWSFFIYRHIVFRGVTVVLKENDIRTEYMNLE